MNPIDNLLAKTIDIGEIPALPEAARIAMYKTLTLEKSAEELSSIIKEDPSLTLKILKVANSPLYLRSGSVTNIKDAIILLGYKTVKAIILSVTIKDIFSGTESDWFSYRNYWVHSIATAFVSEEITRILNLPNEDTAYAAGLLHDIGKIILLISAGEKYRKVVEIVEKEKYTFSSAETKVFGFDHTDASEFLFDYWELPKRLTVPIHEHHMKAAPAVESNDSARLTLRISNEVAHLAGFSISPGEPPYEVSEGIVERLGLLNEDLDSILLTLEKYINTIVDVLNIPKTDIKGFFRILSSANKELGRMYIDNLRMVHEVKTKKSMLSEMNRLSIVFLKERELEAVLPQILRSLLECFHFDAAAIEFFLNGERSIFCRAFYPKLYSKNGTQIKATDIEESRCIIKRGEITPFEEKPSTRSVRYTLKSGDGSDLGVLYINTSEPSDPKEIQTFFDQITLGLNNLRLHLTNKIKTEKLNIAVKQLKEENERKQKLFQLNSLILDNSPYGILSINYTGTIEACNRMAEKLFMQKLEGENIFALRFFQRNNLEKTIKEIVQFGGSGDLTTEWKEKRRTFHVDSIPMEGTRSTLVLVHDITEQMEDELMVIQKEKMATLGELAAGIAHNLRSPLAVIKGIPELIISELEQKRLQKPFKTKGRGEEEIDIRENMELITKSMDKAFAIIDSIMDFSKKEVEQVETVDLSQTVEEAFLLIEHKIKGKNIRFINSTKKEKLIGNKNMLIQIFVNLITNSCEAISEKGIIEVSCRKENGKMVIHVTDNGVGIDRKDLERIFEPFYTTSGRADGTGIGLSITRKMVTLLGGTIRALPKKEGGTVMEIVLPEKGKSNEGIDHRR